MRSDVSRYLSFTLWMFLATPFVRRLVDLHAGWESVNLLMFAPYAAAGFSVLVIPCVISDRRFPARGAFLAIFAVIAYGLLLAMLNGRVLAGIFDFLRWTLPPSLAAFVIYYRQLVPRLRQEIEAFAILSLILTGLYGLFQYLYAPSWDTYWMVQSQMNSIGTPEPYGIRVFSTLNSPGSYSFFLLAMLLVGLAGSGALRLPALGIGAFMLGLTLVRSVWMGLALGLLVVFITGGKRLRANLMIFAVIAAIGAPAILAMPLVGPQLQDRVGTMGSLGGDVSLADRWHGYEQLARQLDSHIIGSGLAVNGTYAGNADEGETHILDGGPLEIFLALGLPGGVLYFSALLVLLLASIRAAGGTADAGHVSIVFTFLALMASGTTTVGEIGLFFWLSVAVLLSGTPSPSESLSVEAARAESGAA